MRRAMMALVLVSTLSLSASAALAVEPFNPEQKETSSKFFMFSIGTGMSPIESVLAISPVSVNSRIGFFVHPKVLVDFGIDFTNFGSSSRYESESGVDDDEDSSATSLLTLHLGSKLFFGKIKRNDVVFYSQTSILLTVPFTDGDDEVIPFDDKSDSLGIGFLQGIGAEYFFAEAFSLGGEFGVNGAFWMTDSSGGIAAEKWTSSSTLRLIDFYTAFTLNFYI